MKRYFLLVTIPLLFFAACKKSSNSTNLNTSIVDTTLLVLQELTYDSNNSLVQTRDFKYDAQNRMTSQYKNRPGEYSANFIYTYNSSGDLVTCSQKDTTYTNATITDTTNTEWTFTYINNIPVSATQSVQQNGGSSTANYTFVVTNNKIVTLNINNAIYAQYTYTGNNLTGETDYEGTNTVTYSTTFNIGKSAFYLSGYKWNLPASVISLSGQNQETTDGIPNAYTDTYNVTAFNTYFPATILETSSLTSTQTTVKYKYISEK